MIRMGKSIRYKWVNDSHWKPFTTFHKTANLKCMFMTYLRLLENRPKPLSLVEIFQIKVFLYFIAVQTMPFNPLGCCKVALFG